MNGLKFIRTRCNFSLSQLADVIGVTRQQISAWEHGRKGIPKQRLEQLSEYFGVDQKYFLEIDEQQKESLIDRALYRRTDTPTETYTFDPGASDDSAQVKNWPHHYQEFPESFDDLLKKANKRKKAAVDDVIYMMDYYNIPCSSMDKVVGINRGCKMVECITKLMAHMQDEESQNRMIYYGMIRDVLYSLMLASGLITQEEIDKDFQDVMGHDIYDTRDWIRSQAKMYEKYYSEKKIS